MIKKRRRNPRYTVLFFLSFLLNLVFACQQEASSPSKVISPQVMTSILIDMHLAEAYIIESRFRNEDSARVAFKKMEKDIFKKYNTDSTNYAQSYQYYATHIEKLDKIYVQVVDSLAKREEAQKALKKEKETKEVANEQKRKPSTNGKLNQKPKVSASPSDE